MKYFRPAAILPVTLASIILAAILCGTTRAADSRPTSQWVFPGTTHDNGGKLVYKTTERGDCIMDFSSAGYMGGGVSLPTATDIPARQTLQPLGNSADDTAAIQHAIDAVSALPPDAHGYRGAILLGSGTFTCSRTLTISASGVVLRGSGSDGHDATIIRMTGGKHIAVVVSADKRTTRAARTPASVAPEPAESFVAPRAVATRGPVTTISDAYVPSGATTFSVASTENLHTGDTIEIKRPTTRAWLALMQMDTLTRNGHPQTWIGTNRTGIHTRTITAMHGNRITIDIPLSDSYDARYLGAGSVEVTQITPAANITHIGVECLRIQCPPLEIAYGDAPFAALRIEGDDCWARDIRCEETMNTIVLRGRRITLRDIAITHTFPNLGASKPADFSIEGTQILIDRCRASGGNNYHIWGTSLNPGPNVVLNSTFTGRGSRIQPHMRWTTGLLLDNCRVPDGGIDFPNRGVAGSGHGWTMGWGVAWNCVAATYVIQQPPGAANWAIGCIGERVRTARYFDSAPILPEGYFDSHGTPVAPRSLYLAQLAERLGTQALANTGYYQNDADNAAALTDPRMAAQLAASATAAATPVDPKLGADLAYLRPVNTSAVRGDTREHGGEKALDGNPQTYWATDDMSPAASAPRRPATLEVDTEGPLLIDTVVISEPDALQNVRAYKIEAQVDSAWTLLAEGTTIGARRAHRFPPVTAWKVRLTVIDAAPYPAISSFNLYNSAAAAPPAAQNLAWREVAPGVWKATIGTSEDFSLLNAAGNIPPMLASLKAMPAAKTFPLDQQRIEACVLPAKTMLRFPLALNEDIYGMGVDFKVVRRTGSIFMLHEDHWSGVTGFTHAPVPFYVSTRGYGVLIDSARYLKVNIGVSVRTDTTHPPALIDRTTNTDTTTGKPAKWSSMPRSDSIEVLVPASGVDVYVFSGPTPMDAIRRYNLFCGGGALPPKWGMGFMSRVPTATTAAEAAAEVKRFRDHGIPLDILGLEPGWHSMAYPCSFEWDTTRFPNPQAFLDEMEKQHIRLNLWFNPYVSPNAPLYKTLKPYAGTHMVWNGIVPDYSMPEARAAFAAHVDKAIVGLNPRSLGGFKIDEVDGGDRYLWADTALFPSGKDGEQLRQTYGLLVQRTIMDVYRAHNMRTMGQVRGTNAGASPYPFVIYNDNYKFDEYITAVGNSGFAGVLWAPEVRKGSAEDVLRRIQAVCFSPQALYNGWATPLKLWDHETISDIRAAIVMRQRMMPYWYNTYAQYHYQGTPVVRPVQLIPGFGSATKNKSKDGKLDATTNPYELGKSSEVTDEYMVGDAILAAPIPAGTQSRDVILPPGKWYDFYTGRYAGSNETSTMTPPLSQMPLYVRDGALIPMIPERLWMPDKDEVVPLEIRHYGEADGELALYDDDGTTFDYEKGDCSWTTLRVKRSADGQWQTTVTPDTNGKKWRYSKVTWTFMTK